MLEPDGSELECGGIINPASARLRDGTLALYPRLVGPNNVSRIGRCRAIWTQDQVAFERDGFALEPEAGYEFRQNPGGYGCEDPRVTYVAALDLYLMAYCAYGPGGTKVAVASSSDGWNWTRLGIVAFRVATHIYGDKDAAFFPDVVTSPSGVPSIALLHRPTRHQSVARGRALAPSILQLQPKERESIFIGYVPLERARVDAAALLEVVETRQVVYPHARFGAVKVGAGPPPVRVGDGWLLIYHGIDVLPGYEESEKPVMQYRAAFAILDADGPDQVLYRAASRSSRRNFPKKCTASSTTSFFRPPLIRVPTSASKPSTSTTAWRIRASGGDGSFSKALWKTPHKIGYRHRMSRPRSSKPGADGARLRLHQTRKRSAVAIPHRTHRAHHAGEPA